MKFVHVTYLKFDSCSTLGHRLMMTSHSMSQIPHQRCSSKCVNLSTFKKREKKEKSLSTKCQVTKTHCKESLQGLPDFVSLLMDGLCNTGVARDIRISHSGALEQEQVSEGCLVHK